MAAGIETGQLLGQLRSYLARLTDDHTRLMAGAWAKAWDDVAPEMASALAELQADAVNGTLTRAKIVKAQRLQNALALVETRLTGLFDESASNVIDRLPALLDQAGLVTDRLISSQLPHGQQVEGWSRVDPAQVDAIVQRATEQITKASFPLSDQATASMRRELVRGMLTGANPRQVGARMLQRTEGIFNGGLGRAVMIARTEQLDAHRAAAQLAEKANSEVVTGWVWTAALSARTCPACWSKNGEEFPVDQAGPNGHQNCRCVRIPTTKTWKQLGFDVDEPPSLQPDAAAEFDRLSTGEQLDILGPARFAAWRAGKFPMSKWATLRHTDGWRDSFVPSPAPNAFRGVRRSTVDDTTKPWQFGRNAKQLGGIPRDTLKAIQALHDVPLLKDALTVVPLSVTKRGLQGRFDPNLLRLEINPNAIGKGLTTAHEFGHYLDFQMFGNAKGWASATSTSPEWAALRTAFAASPEVQELKALAADSTTAADLVAHIRYLTSDTEMFGRAYAQWIALKTGRKGLQDDLARMRKLSGPDGHRQWDATNFEPIGAALDVLFASTLKR